MLNNVYQCQPPGQSVQLLKPRLPQEAEPSLPVVHPSQISRLERRSLPHLSAITGSIKLYVSASFSNFGHTIHFFSQLFSI